MHLKYTACFVLASGTFEFIFFSPGSLSLCWIIIKVCGNRGTLRTVISNSKTYRHWIENVDINDRVCSSHRCAMTLQGGGHCGRLEHMQQLKEKPVLCLAIATLKSAQNFSRSSHSSRKDRNQ